MRTFIFPDNKHKIIHRPKQQKSSFRYTILFLYSNEAQKTWLSNTMPLPEGISLTSRQMIAFLESKAVPIIYSFEELYNQFGIAIHWEYENGYPVRGIVDNSAGNRRVFIQGKAYIDSIAAQQTASGIPLVKLTLPETCKLHNIFKNFIVHILSTVL